MARSSHRVKDTERICASMLMTQPAINSAPQLLQVDRKLHCSSATIAPETLRELQTALHSSAWFTDRLANRRFQAAARAVLRSHAPGGLIVLGPGLGFEPPPPFVEAFEPIQLGADDPQLQTLAGPGLTRQERQTRVIFWILGILGAGIYVTFLLMWLRGGSAWPALGLGLTGAMVAVTIGLARSLMKLGGHWYLLPGSVAVVRRRGRPQDRLILRTRFDTVAVLRMVFTGNVLVLTLELWGHESRKMSRSVSDREAISFLAAWQSPLPPPPRERLDELVA